MNNREIILNKIKIYSKPKSDVNNITDVPNFSSDLVDNDFLEKFLKQSQLVSTEVILFRTENELSDLLNVIIQRFSLSKILIDERIKNCFKLSDTKFEFFDTTDDNIKDLLKEERCFFELCELACSDTSSLYFYSNKIKSNYQSLYPEIHLVLLNKENIFGFKKCMIKLEELSKINQNIVSITGPSRTADIEKILVLGAHGPKNLIVLLKN